MKTITVIVFLMLSWTASSQCLYRLNPSSQTLWPMPPDDAICRMQVAPELKAVIHLDVVYIEPGKNANTTYQLTFYPGYEAQERVSVATVNSRPGLRLPYQRGLKRGQLDSSLKGKDQPEPIGMLELGDMIDQAIGLDMAERRKISMLPHDTTEFYIWATTKAMATVYIGTAADYNKLGKNAAMAWKCKATGKASERAAAARKQAQEQARQLQWQLDMYTTAKECSTRAVKGGSIFATRFKDEQLQTLFDAVNDAAKTMREHSMVANYRIEELRRRGTLTEEKQLAISTLIKERSDTGKADQQVLQQADEKLQQYADEKIAELQQGR